MRRALGVLLLLISSLQLYGQVDPIEKLMTRRFLSCADIFYNVSYLIPEYYAKEDRDTLQAVIRFWENKCGRSESSVRCKIILSISDGVFNENLYDDDMIEMLLEYKHNTLWKNGHSYGDDYSDHLDRFTTQLSEELLATKDLPTIERVFLGWYSNDFEHTFPVLNSEDLKGTRIHDLYVQHEKEKEQALYMHCDLMGGAWIPQGNAEILGVHPFLGFRGGIKYKKLTADLGIGFKFGKSPNMYQVYKNGVMWDTDHFFGGYIGLDVGRELFALGKSGFDLIGGIALDGFDALSVDVTESDKKINKSINSLNLNIGIGYKYYISDICYMGIDFKYNFVNYNNPNGTNLDGNAFTINLIFGGINGRWGNQRMGY